MNDKDSKQLAKVYMESQGNSLIDQILPSDDVMEMHDTVDRETFDLVVKIYDNLQEALRLTDGQWEALNRIKMSIEHNRTGFGGKALVRNNVFKAANALGIELPSSMF